MLKSKRKFAIGFLLARLIVMPTLASAEEDPSTAASVSAASAEPETIIPAETWNAKFQQTYIWQKKPSFNAPYTGANSLSTDPGHGYSSTVTAFFGYRPWQGGELYFDLEMIQSVPLSGLHGLGGLTNGEQQKTSGPNPTFYRARLDLKQTFGLAVAQNGLKKRIVNTWPWEAWAPLSAMGKSTTGPRGSLKRTTT